MSAGQHAKMLALYRNIIRHAQVYPSKSRDRVLREIRLEFRKNASETDPEKVDKQRQIAMKGLEQLMMYTTMDRTGMNLSVTLEQNPLGAPPTRQR